jgi:hypothetical protein
MTEFGSQPPYTPDASKEIVPVGPINGAPNYGSGDGVGHNNGNNLYGDDRPGRLSGASLVIEDALRANVLEVRRQAAASSPAGLARDSNALLLKAETAAIETFHDPDDKSLGVFEATKDAVLARPGRSAAAPTEVAAAEDQARGLEAIKEAEATLASATPEIVAVQRLDLRPEDIPIEIDGRPLDPILLEYLHIRQPAAQFRAAIVDHFRLPPDEQERNLAGLFRRLAIQEEALRKAIAQMKEDPNMPRMPKRDPHDGIKSKEPQEGEYDNGTGTVWRVLDSLGDI